MKNDKKSNSATLMTLRRELAKVKKDFASYQVNAQLELVKTKKFIQYLFVQQEEDRKQISRDLHDEVGQILTAINFELSILRAAAFKMMKC